LHAGITAHPSLYYRPLRMWLQDMNTGYHFPDFLRSKQVGGMV
jgi:hypothetical protein